MFQTSSFAIKDTTANPAPLGLFGFGMTTVLLNLHNAGFYELDSMILGMGIFYGGLAQVFAGVMEGKKGKTFGLTAFTSYGFFWLTLVALLVMPKLGWIAAPSATGMAAYFTMWGVFTTIFFIGTLKINRAEQVVFASLAILFFLLAVCEATGSASLKQLTGFEGIFCGASAIYTGAAIVLNDVYGKTILPLGPVKNLSSFHVTAKSRQGAIAEQ
jgi:uncharacterized protein